MQLRKLFWVLLLWPMLVSAHHADKDSRGLRDVTVLIAWHHGHIVKLIEALGDDAKQLLGRKTWPGDVYNWVVVLHFDSQGRLSESTSRLVQEHLLPGD
jgi:hypothetical protein